MEITEQSLQILNNIISLSKNSETNKDDLIIQIQQLEMSILFTKINKKPIETFQTPLQTNLQKQEFKKSLFINREKIERYSRQMILKEIGLEGQVKIQKSKILIIGAGGLGSPAALYLAGMGVGQLGIVDGDRIELSNLHRQIIHTSQRKGLNKAASACKTIQAFNPLTDVQIYETFLNEKNAQKIIQDYDIILDASDNAKTRYLVNDAVIIYQKILVSGAAVGWSGQLTVHGYKNGPCYRCLNPICPKQVIFIRKVQNCADAGVVGMIPGIIGTLQALETIKIILEMNDVLSQKMLLFDGQQANFRKITLRAKQQNCIVCGDNPSLLDVQEYDYQNFSQGSICSIPIFPTLQSQHNITWADFFKNGFDKDSNRIFIDVRPKNQFEIIHLKLFKNIPIDQFVEMDIKSCLENFYNLKNSSISFQKFIQCVEEEIILELPQNIFWIYILTVILQNIDVINLEGGIEEYGKQFDKEIPFI